MARIRSIHPGFFTDEAYVSLSPLARLLAIGIWNECDDQGVFEWKPLQLKMRILPADNADIAALMAELAGVDVVRAFDAGGHKYGACRNFQQYQRPKKPKYSHPLPKELRTYVAGKQSGSEPDEDEGGQGSEPTPSQSGMSGEPVPHQRQMNVVDLPSSSRKSSQMEEGGGREETPSLRSGTPLARGSRLPPDWQPNDECRAFAFAEGLNPETVAARFRDYWHAKAGKDAAKRDWPAVWRNWCRTEANRSPPARAAPNRQAESREKLRRYVEKIQGEPDYEPRMLLQ